MLAMNVRGHVARSHSHAYVAMAASGRNLICALRRASPRHRFLGVVGALGSVPPVRLVPIPLAATSCFWAPDIFTHDLEVPSPAIPWNMVLARPLHYCPLELTPPYSPFRAQRIADIHNSVAVPAARFLRKYVPESNGPQKPLTALLAGQSAFGFRPLALLRGFFAGFTVPGS